jgi:dTDP-4-dehydrorhamnose reductase
MAGGPILVTGASGQVGGALAERAGTRALRTVARPHFDFDRPETLARVLDETAPSLVVNAAAYTAVDRAETEAEAARRANAEGPALLAAWCARAGVPLIHISTDYVFDGRKGAPYVETDPTNPTCVYGATKLAGERAVLAAGGRAIVLRTSWVYAAAGKNFVLTMLNLARTRPRLAVVADQIGCPTAAGDLAAAILAIADRIAAGGWQDGFGGLFHAAGSGWTSWHGLAEAAIAAAARHGHPRPEVAAITSAEFPTPVRRPADSRLDCGKLAAVFGLRLPPWQDALERTIARIFREAADHPAAST